MINVSHQPVSVSSMPGAADLNTIGQQALRVPYALSSKTAEKIAPSVNGAVENEVLIRQVHHRPGLPQYQCGALLQSGVNGAEHPTFGAPGLIRRPAFLRAAPIKSRM
jgi:hypothetical protein